MRTALSLKDQAAIGAHFRASLGIGGKSLRVNNRLHHGCAVCANERGRANDPGQIVADLISDNRSPFTGADENALRTMTMPALIALRDKLLGAPADDEPDDDEVLDPDSIAANAMLAAAGITPGIRAAQLRMFNNQQIAAIQAASGTVVASDDEEAAAMFHGEQLMRDHLNHVRTGREKRTKPPQRRPVIQADDEEAAAMFAYTNARG